MSAACYHFKSFKDYKKSKHLLQLVPEVVNRVNKALYGSEEPHTYGDYLVTEIELNQMKSNVSGYYVVESTIPIFYSNARLIVPSGFHPIQTFTPRRQDETFDKQELYGDLPQRSSANIQCPFCHLHFSSERQCKRHQRVHKELEEEKANVVELEEEKANVVEQGEEMEIVAKDGSYLVPREEVWIFD